MLDRGLDGLFDNVHGREARAAVRQRPTPEVPFLHRYLTPRRRLVLESLRHSPALRPYVAALLSYGTALQREAMPALRRVCAHVPAPVTMVATMLAIRWGLQLVFWLVPRVIIFVVLPVLLVAGSLFVFLLHIVREECPICAETVSPLEMVSARSEQPASEGKEEAKVAAVEEARGPCACRCCTTCMARYLEVGCEQRLARLRLARNESVVKCFGGCGAPLRSSLALAFGQPELRKCYTDLRERRRLIAAATCAARGDNGKEWVECPRMGCVGVAYRGKPKLMCFLCLRQWDDPQYGALRRFWGWVSAKLWPTRLDGAEGWRPCPHCGAAIVKNGGCPNMRCLMCDRVFRWGPYGNSVFGASVANAPPSMARSRAARAAAARQGGGGRS